MSYRELLLGCGSRREKDKRLPIKGEGFVNLTTLDINVDHKPDILFNLERIDGQTCNRIPMAELDRPDPYSYWTYEDSCFDEIHAYEVLEHIGRQGDYRKFFDQFSEFWRILKPGGYLFATVPSWQSQWAWADPSHTRVIAPGTLVFLSQKEYQRQVGVTPMTDFRWYYKADFDLVYSQDDGQAHCFMLQAVK